MADSSKQPRKVVPGIPLAALDAVVDRNARDVLRAIVDGLNVRNNAVGNGDDRFVTSKELTAVQSSQAYTQTKTGSTAGAGADTWLDVAAMSITMAAPGLLHASSTGTIAYSGAWAASHTQLLIDGVVVSQGGGTDPYQNALHAGSLMISKARTVVVRLQFSSAASTVSVVNPTLFATAAVAG